MNLYDVRVILTVISVVISVFLMVEKFKNVHQSNVQLVRIVDILQNRSH